MFQPSPKKNNNAKLYQTKQQYEQLINCQICYCKANQPILCPHCSKIFCQLCIATSLKLKSQCPNCRKIIKGQLTNCTRFINQLSNIITQLFQSSQQAEKCGQHGISLNYFCEDCHKSACCECKMFGLHQNHIFKSISLIYEAKYERIRQLLSDFKSKIMQKQQMLMSIENNLISVKAKTQANIVQIEQYTKKYRNKMINQCTNDNQEYQNIEELTKWMQQLQQIKQSLLSKIQHANKTNCYKIDALIFDKLETILTKNKLRFENSKNTTVIEQAIPQFQTFKIIINNYSVLKIRNQPYYSQSMFYQQSQWRLVVYLNGNTNRQYISIFLELLKNPDNINLYVYEIQLIHPEDESLNFMKEHHSKFNLNQCWGYGKFLKIQELQTLKYINKIEDNIKFHVGIKFCSYYDLFKRRQTILKNLQNSISINQQAVKQMESKMDKRSLLSIDLQ